MYQKLVSIILAVLLGVTFLVSGSDLRFFLLAVIGFGLLVNLVNWWRIGFYFAHLVLPWFYLLAAAIGYAVITEGKWQLAFLFLAVGMFYWLELNLGQESYVLQSLFLLSTFGLFVGLFALQFYFHANLVWILPLTFGLTWLLTLYALTGFTLSQKKYFNLLIPFLVTQAALALSLWPTHFLVNAVVLFSAFYLLWFFTVSAFFGRLTAKKIYWQLTLVGLVLVLVLSTAAWQPLLS